MQRSIRRASIQRIKTVLIILAAGALTYFQPACSTLTSSQKGALLVGAETLANIAGTAAATYYGGPAAGQLASAGLSALASVLQGYVGATVPTSIVQASPGVANVGQAVAQVIAPNSKVTQSDVNTINAAAAVAQTLKLTPAPTQAAPSPGPGAAATGSQQ
jgi:hypothetical protein